MLAIRLRVHETIYEKLMWFHGKLSKEEIQIMRELDNYIKNASIWFRNWMESSVRKQYLWILERQRPGQRLQPHRSNLSTRCFAKSKRPPKKNQSAFGFIIRA